MSELQEVIQKDYEKWEKTPPNIVNRGLGPINSAITKVTDIVPFWIRKKVNKSLEKIVSKMNEFIADAIEHFSGEIPNFENMDKKIFKEWFEKADKSATNYERLGIATATAEGGGTGLFGFIGLLVDIPTIFSIILGYSNKIALAYGLPIKNEDVQIAILNAISAGSASNLEEKTTAVVALKQIEKTLHLTWKEIYRIAADNVMDKGLETLASSKVIVAFRTLLEKMGFKITKRMAGKIVPGIGLVLGAGINGAWASDVLEAVRQFSRKWIVDTYYSGINHD